MNQVQALLRRQSLQKDEVRLLQKNFAMRQALEIARLYRTNAELRNMHRIQYEIRDLCRGYVV